MIESALRLWNGREEILGLGHDYYMAKRLMSVQRVFHRSRVNRIRAVDIDVLSEIAERQAAASVPQVGESA